MWDFIKDPPWWFFAIGIGVIAGLVVLLVVLRKQQQEE